MAGETRATKSSRNSGANEKKGRREEQCKKKGNKRENVKFVVESEESSTEIEPQREKSVEVTSEIESESECTDLYEMEVEQQKAAKKRARQRTSSDEEIMRKSTKAPMIKSVQEEIEKKPATTGNIEPKAAVQTAESTEKSFKLAPNSLEEVSKMAASASNDILALCLAPGNQLSKENSDAIITAVSKLQELVGIVALRCARLEGSTQVAQINNEMEEPVPARGSYAAVAAVKSSPNAPMSENRTRGTINVAIHNAGARKVTQIPQKKTTIAEIIKGAAVAPKKNEIVIRPAKQTANAKSEETRKILMSAINPAKEKILVNSVRLRRDGAVIVQTESAEHLEVFEKSSQLKKAGLKAEKAEGERPRIIIFDVPSFMSAEEMTDNIVALNAEELRSKKAQIIPIFKTGKKDQDTVHWVAEVSPSLRKVILEQGKLKVGWKICRVRDYLTVARCFRCQVYGHISKHCVQKEDVCKQCTKTGHRRENCPQKTNGEICVSCKRARREYNHTAGSKACETYSHALKIRASRISYN